MLLTKRLGEKNVYVLANGFATQYGKFTKTKTINKNKGIGKRWGGMPLVYLRNNML